MMMRNLTFVVIKNNFIYSIDIRSMKKKPLSILKSFIQSMIKALKELNIDESKIHYETFIPKLSVAV